MTTPLYRDDGVPIGPSTLELQRPLHDAYQKLLADCVANTADGDATVTAVRTVFDEQLLQTFSGVAPLPDRWSEVEAILIAEDEPATDPFRQTLLMELRQSMNRRVSGNYAAAWQTRQVRSCPLTLQVLLAWLTRMDQVGSEDRKEWDPWVIENLAELLAAHPGADGPPRWYRDKLLDVVTALSPAGQVECTLRLVAMYEEDLQNAEARTGATANAGQRVGDALLHAVLERIYSKISAAARGGDFADQVTDRGWKVFRDHAQLSMLHLLRRVEADPQHSTAWKELFERSIRSGVPLVSNAQMYRLTLMSQRDSFATTDLMATAMQSRWGGSNEQLMNFINLLVDFSKADVDNRYVFHQAIWELLQDLGPFGSLAERTTLDESLLELLDDWQANHGDDPDPRMQQRPFNLIIRLLWDRGDLERIASMQRTYPPFVDNSGLYDYKCPSWAVQQVMSVWNQPGCPRESLARLQQGLFVGDEFYRDEELKQLGRDATTLSDWETSRPEHVVTEEGSQERDDWDAAQFAALNFRSSLSNLEAYRRGEVVSLSSDDAAPQTIYSGYDSGRTDGKTVIRCRADNSRTHYVPMLRFEPPHTLEITVRQGPCDTDPYGVALFAGQVSPNSTSSPQRGRSLRYSPGYPMVMQDDLPAERLLGRGFVQRRIIPVMTYSTMHLVVTPTGSRGYLDGELISETNDGINTRGHVSMGRVCGAVFTGVSRQPVSYTIKSWTIRKGIHDPPPPEPVEPPEPPEPESAKANQDDSPG